MTTQSQLRCLSDYPAYKTQEKVYKIMSGCFNVKFCKKLMSKFREKYVELVYIEEKVNENVTSGRYEMRLYKDLKKISQSFYSFAINPTTLKFYENDLKSKKHPFTFICSSLGVSICFSVDTEFERNGWLWILQQLQWKYRPNINDKEHVETSNSNTTPLNSQNNDGHEYVEEMEYVQLENDWIGDNYNYYKSNLYHNDKVNTGSAQRCTILEILNTK